MVYRSSTRFEKDDDRFSTKRSYDNIILYNIKDHDCCSESDFYIYIIIIMIIIICAWISRTSRYSLGNPRGKSLPVAVCNLRHQNRANLQLKYYVLYANDGLRTLRDYFFYFFLLEISLDCGGHWLTWFTLLRENCCIHYLHYLHTHITHITT